MATRRLRISADLSLPLEATTQAVAILAKRGAGKTYTAGVWAEEMLGAGLQVVILDPMGAWYGLRSSADGKEKGYPIAILGGEKQDVPLEATGGLVVADLAVDERLSMIIDQSEFSKNERRRFVTDFLERLYHRNRDAMHVILEEADLYAPQRYGQGDERMLGAVFDVVRRGRGRGLGSTLITQRSATLNNEVLEQADILMVLRTTGPADRKAIDRWIDVHDDLAARKDVRDSLPKLPTGTAWVWWPENELLQRVAIRQKTTFDSSDTPKPGQARRAPKTVADVDLTALRDRMAATIEKAKADDPRELRKKIQRLEREAAAVTRVAPEPELREVIVEVPILNGNVTEDLRALVSGIVDAGQRLIEVATAVGDSAARIDQVGTRIIAAIDLVSATPRAAPERDAAPARGRVGAGVRPAQEQPGAPSVAMADRALDKPAGGAPMELGEVRLKAGARRMLAALAQLHPTALTRSQMALLADMSMRSGTWSDYMSSLRVGGLIVESGELLGLSPAGEAVMAGQLGSGAPASHELLTMWSRKLKAGARRMLAALHEAYPDGLSRQELGDRAEISTASGTWSDYLSSLRVNGLLEERGGLLYAGEALFLGERR